MLQRPDSADDQATRSAARREDRFAPDATDGDGSDLETLIEEFETQWLAASRTLNEFLKSRSPLAPSALAELVRCEMEHRWQRGEEPTADDYRRDFPSLAASSDAIEGIAFEEYRQRSLAGRPLPPEHWRERYGPAVERWPLLTPAGDPKRPSSTSSRPERSGRSEGRPRSALHGWPAGSRFAGFEIVGPLGEGAHGTVVLATQRELADRFVVLKISRGETCEPQLLAELQHTNIMPILSLHREGEFLAICMPFLGAATLRDVQRSTNVGSGRTRFDQACLETVLDRKSREIRRLLSDGERTLPETSVSTRRDPNVLLVEAGRGRVGAILWLVERIAEGLAHAHRHGIVHGDLKPANILISDDGQPLLLDFHLSQWVARDGGIPEGGTLPYMAPEHLRAMSGDGRIDHRSDLYSLGTIFYELLTDRPPYPLPELIDTRAIDRVLEGRSIPPPPIRNLGSDTSVDLDSIVRKCLAARPEDRYADCDQLLVDLRRHREHRPLVHAPRRSTIERGRKWWRRNGSVAVASAVVGTTAVGCLALGTFLTIRTDQLRSLEAIDGARHFEERLAAATAPLTEVGTSEPMPDETFSEGLALLAERGATSLETWRDRDSIDRLPESLREDEQSRIGQAYFWLAHAELQRSRLESRAPSAESLAWNRLAERFAETRSMRSAIDRQRRLLLGEELADLDDLATDDEELGGTAAECLMTASILVARRETDDRSTDPLLDRVLQRAIELDPDHHAAWLMRGNEHARRGLLTQAIADFSLAVALAPENPRSRFHRGLARFQAGEFAEAAEDFRAVVIAQPDSVAARFNRLASLYEAGDLEAATDEIDRWLASDLPRSGRFWFTVAKVRARTGDAARSQEALSAAAEAAPRDEADRLAIALARLQLGRTDAAIAMLRETIERYPSSVAAQQNLAHLLGERSESLPDSIAAMDEVVRLNGPDPKRLAAALAARGVLHARAGNAERAVADGNDAIERDPSPENRCQLAAIHALLATEGTEVATRFDSALRQLARAAWDDPALVRRRLEQDPDLASLREVPEIEALSKLLVRLGSLAE